GGSYGSPCNGIDLSAWAGQPNVRIAFEAVSTLGNNIYLDDIRITNVLAAGEALQDEPQLSVFPNPSDGHVTLGWKNLSGKFHLRLNNLQGKTVYSIDIQLTEGNYLSLDVSALPAGMYLMDLVGDSQVVSRKLILR
ncbi:MAG TPA: T9SS type A sorting domain-containing protein, partial [Bacteroidales bacterium]|nr:T9SS type A sorting domain-containing protein [Bacteroidales bacterium]